MPTVGQKLKEAREAKKVSIEQAHRDTKIHLKVLRAFEEDTFDVLSPIYVKSFLKKYCGYLGIDGNAVVNEYAALYPQVTKVSLEPQRSVPESKRVNLKPLAIGAAVVVVSLLSIYFLSYRISLGMVERSGKEASSLDKKKEEKKAFPVLPKNIPLALTVIASEDAWLQIKSDGKTIFQNVLPKSSTKKIQAQKTIELWSGKAQALSLELNGRALGILGNGVVKGFVITREGVKRR